MSSGGFTVTISGLATCQQAIAGQAGNIGSAGDTFSTDAVSGSDFGTLPAVSGQLSDITTRLSAAGGRQFGAAKAFLSATAGALGQARQSYVATEQANTSAARSIISE
jgi:hypothetical protein